MAYSNRRRAFCPVLILKVSLTFIIGLPIAAAAQDPIKWQLLDPDCDLPGVELLACGRHGKYLFQELRRSSNVRTDTCELLGRGQELPPGLLAPASQALLWQPCENGSCFEVAGTVPPDQYAAVVDWNDAHGHTVGATIQQVANGMPLKLYDLTKPGITLIQELPTIGDAHVLAQLCSVAEDAETNPATAVNMSFGRAPGAPIDCGSSESLSCEVEDVLAHLRDSYSALEIAAAGNHGTLLFPASTAGVVSAGSLNLSSFGPTGASVPHAQTPPDTTALFPGYGLFLEEPNGTRVWAAPAGTSYASAVATGWLLGYERFYPGSIDPLRLGTPGVTIVAKRAPDATARLYLNGAPLEGSDLSAPIQMLRTTLGQRPHVCNALLAQQSFVLDLVATTAPTLDLSFVGQSASAIHPAPDSAPCVPCQLHPRRRGRAAEEFEGVVLDLEAAAGIAAGVQLEAVYLKRNEEWFEFAGRDIALFLAALQNGDGGEAILADFEFSIDADVSMVYQLRNITDDILYWDLTPIAVHQDSFDAFILFDDFESGSVETVW